MPLPYGPPPRPADDASAATSAASAVAGLAADGAAEMVVSFFVVTASWVGLFYFLVFTESHWAASVPQSLKRHENDKYWAARNLLGIIHAVIIACIAVPAYFVLAGAPDWIRFGSTQHLATCRMGAELLARGGGWASGLCQAIAFAGLAFTSFTAADLVISYAHGLATPSFVAHHVAFITAGLIIRGHCMLPYNASILLTMEVSTPFLNYMLFFRNRGEAYRFSVRWSGVVFAVLFVAFRLGVNTYGAAVLLSKSSSAMPGSVPEWQWWFMLLAITGGAAVQFFWFPAIARNFVRGLAELRGGGETASGLEARLLAH